MKCTGFVLSKAQICSFGPLGPIYQQTGNLRAARLLLGHASIESTKEYFGTEQAETLEIARKYDL